MKTSEITRTTYKVSDFISWLKQKSLILSPSFQRRSVWKPGAKSYLVDTVAKGFPMPIIFLRDKGVNLETLEPIREVVDGQQRIRTLVSYIQPKLVPGFDLKRDPFVVLKAHNSELAEKKFDDLDEELRQRILNYTFSVHVLPSSTDDREVLQIFARMNSTGLKLNRQELRNAAYYGEFKTAAYAAAFNQLFRWRKWRVFSEDNIARMDEVEMTSELILYTLKGITGKTQTALDNAYDTYDPKLPHIKVILSRIEAVFDQIDDAFGEEIKNMPFRKKAWFYAFFVASYEHLFDAAALDKKVRTRTLSKAEITRVKAAAHDIAEEHLTAAVIEAAARRTTHPSSRKALVGFLKAALNGD